MNRSFLKSAALGMILSGVHCLSGCDGGSNASAGPESGIANDDGSVVQNRALQISQGAALLVGMDDSIQLSATFANGNGAEFAANGVEWSSSHPDIISVDASGKVEARAPLGSALITAATDSQISDPMLVAAVIPTDNVQLLPDHLFLEDPEFLDVSLLDIQGSEDNAVALKSVLSIASPTIGSLMMSTGDTQFAGRVIAEQPLASGVEVMVEPVLPQALFRQLRIEESISLERRTATDFSVPNSATEAFDTSGMLLSNSDLICSDTFGLAPEGLQVNMDIHRDLTQLDGSLIWNITDQATDQFELAVQGNLRVGVSGQVERSATLQGLINCQLELANASLLPAHGTLGLLQLQAFLSVNLQFDAEGEPVGTTTTIDSFYNSDIQIQSTYAPSSNSIIYQASGTAIDDSTFAVELTNDLTDTSTIGLTSSIQLDVGTRLTRWPAIAPITEVVSRWSMLSSDIVSFATTEKQISDPTYSASLNQSTDLQYTVFKDPSVLLTDSLVNEATATQVRRYLDAIDNDPSVDLYNDTTRSQSLPTGSLSAPPLIYVDESAELTVSLSDALTADNPDVVNHIQIYRQAVGDGIADRPERVATLTPESDVQTTYRWRFQPTEDELGENRFSAFVANSNYPSMPFEIAANSTATVNVLDIAPRMTQPATASTPDGARVVLLNGQSNANPQFFKAINDILEESGAKYDTGHYYSGGAPISNWIDEQGQPQFRWQQMLDVFDGVTQGCSSEDSDITSITLVYFQGEADVGALASYQAVANGTVSPFKRSLDAFVRAVSDHFISTCGIVPGISLALVGYDVQHPSFPATLAGNLDLIRAEIQSVADRHANVAAFETIDLPRADHVHLELYPGSDSQKTAAQRALNLH